MADYSYDDLDRLLVQVRRIEEHRVKGAEQEIKETYEELLQELRHYLADTYSQYAEDDRLTYGILQKYGYYARFLEEVERKIDSISPAVKQLIRSTVEMTYAATYGGLVEAVKKAAGGAADLGGLKGCTPDVMKKAVENPVSKLTLDDRLEKHRKEIVYDIKQNISVGLMNGDRYSTVANRIKQSVNGDYKKAIRITRTETHRVRQAGEWDASMEADKQLQGNGSTMRITKTWRTMKDERVRPAKRYKTKKGWKDGKPGKYDHKSMEGVTLPVDEEFKLPSGATAQYPGGSGVAGEDINCRCYLSYKLQKIAGNDKIKEIKVPQEALDANNITPEIVQSIQEGIDVMQQEYDINLSRVIVEDISQRHPDAPYVTRYTSYGGVHGAEIVINKGFDFSGFENIVRIGYEEGYFAGKSVKDHVIHEMVHVMTGQNFKTASGFDAFAEILEKKYVPGVSGYSDNAKDGFETLAEAYVRMRNGEWIPEEARKMVSKYVERWKKQ